VRRRGPRLLIIAAIVVVFLVVSALLARVYASVSAERTGVTALVVDEARGDQAQMIHRLYRCGASGFCRTRVAQDATSLRRSGQVSVLELSVSSSFPIFGKTGVARVAWETPGQLPVTQCVRVRHSGNPISGMKVELLEISARIKTNGDCPAKF
jgi:hypothetical protein